MFKPKFKYTDHMIGLLTRIAAAREVILSSPLIPRWEISLRRDAIIRSAHSSTSIEGNNLSLEQVSDLAAGRKIMVQRKDREEVLNYIRVLEKLYTLPQKGELTEAVIKKIQKMLTLNTLEDAHDCGAYRSERSKYVVVANRLTGEISFRPPSNEELPTLMADYVKWLNSNEAHLLDPVVMAGIAHYEFVRIHPFVDGNGRTARVIAALILHIRGFDTKQFFCLDDYYDMDRSEYYKALRTVHVRKRDLTRWLEYFIEGVAVSIDAVRERVAHMSAERIRTEKKGQIALTERQMRIVEFINKNGKITIGDVAGLFKITRQAALKEMGKLLDMEVVKREGQARASHYVMA
ncbi:MAG: Fic family protein [Deltaproteobacteria bacterium]|nr:Fic family protein [Deltaproteobacteria bacterium]